MFSIIGLNRLFGIIMPNGPEGVHPSKAEQTINLQQKKNLKTEEIRKQKF